MIVQQLILENVEDLFNIGAIIRLADGFGISEVILLGKSPNFLENHTQHKKTKNYARQGLDTVSIKYYKDFSEYKKEYNNHIAIIEITDNAQHYKKISTLPLQNISLLLGSEHHGVSQEILQLNLPIFFIPMHGKNISHNIAQSAAIILGHIYSL